MKKSTKKSLKNKEKKIVKKKVVSKKTSIKKKLGKFSLEVHWKVPLKYLEQTLTL